MLIRDKTHRWLYGQRLSARERISSVGIRYALDPTAEIHTHMAVCVAQGTAYPGSH